MELPDSTYLLDIEILYKEVKDLNTFLVVEEYLDLIAYEEQYNKFYILENVHTLKKEYNCKVFNYDYSYCNTKAYMKLITEPRSLKRYYNSCRNDKFSHNENYCKVFRIEILNGKDKNYKKKTSC